ncbi:hypothetical protein HYX14_02920 [Candidatus Woesearchaeota archaeon]|nr:hypothetical protein [Candidatus Woesearchaeota archaeon]
MTMETFTRFPAIKLTIRQILDGTYVQEQEQSPNYLLCGEEKIYRLNIGAIVVNKEELGNITNLWIDDGTGKIIARSFEENAAVSRVMISDAVMVIGRVRMYDQEKYLAIEIIRKINLLWLKVRALELHHRKLRAVTAPQAIVEEVVAVESVVEEPLVQGGIVFPSEQKDNVLLVPLQKLARLIRELDEGQGVPIETLIERSSIVDTEKILEQMIAQGEVFQNLPGRVKAL